MATAASVTSPSVIKRIFLVIFSSVLLYFCVQLLRYHYLLVTFPYPLAYREGAVLFTTDLLLKGKNPYSLQNMPTAMNVYGINCHFFVYPFAKLWGATFVVHRAVSAVFLILSCILFFQILRRHQVNVIYSLSAVLILYASLLYRQTPLARPDCLGFFLFLLSMFIPWLQKYSTRSLLISVVLGVAGFYTKAYYVLSIPYLAAYLFLFVSKKKAIFYGSLSALLLILTAFITNEIFETYFVNTFFNHVNVATNDINQLRLQLALFLIYNSGLVLLFVVYSALSVFDRTTEDSRESLRFVTALEKLIKRINVPDYDKPFLDTAFPLSLYALILSFGLFYFKLGRHNGSMMTYAYQLITPFFLLFTYSLLNSPLKNLRSAKLINNYGYVLFMPCILLSLYLLWSSAFSLKDSREWLSMEDWRHIEKITRSHENILNSPVIVSILMEQNKAVYDAGQIEYFKYSHCPPGWLDGFLLSNTAISERWQEYENFVRQAVQQQAFDAVMVTPWERAPYPEGLQEYYSLVDTVEVCMFHTEQCWQLETWEPK